MVARWLPNRFWAEPFSIFLLDVQSHQLQVLPGSDTVYSPRWSPDGGHLGAISADSRRLLSFDFTTQKWSEWVNEAGSIGFPTWSRDGSYLYYNNAFTDHPAFKRIKVGRTRSEYVLDLKDIRRYNDFIVGEWSGLAPDGSALFLRDLSTQEVYALDLKLP